MVHGTSSWVPLYTGCLDTANHQNLTQAP
eukprot:COSAG05_NODE_1942_length_3800_cov_1.897595_8_plen_28_part_01